MSGMPNLSGVLAMLPGLPSLQANPSGASLPSLPDLSARPVYFKPARAADWVTISIEREEHPEGEFTVTVALTDTLRSSGEIQVDNVGRDRRGVVWLLTEDEQVTAREQEEESSR